MIAIEHLDGGKQNVAAPLRVVAMPSLFREPSARKFLTVPHGASLLELLLLTNMGELRGDVVHLPGRVVCQVDGHEIDREDWIDCRPDPGQLVNISLVPGNQRQAILIGASLAIGVAAIATGGLAAGAFGPLAGGAYAGSAGALFAGGITAAAFSVGGSYGLREPWPAP